MASGARPIRYPNIEAHQPRFTSQFSSVVGPADLELDFFFLPFALVLDRDRRVRRDGDSLTRHLNPEAIIILDRVGEAPQLRYELLCRILLGLVACSLLPGHVPTGLLVPARDRNGVAPS